MSILAFAATKSRNSINRALVDCAATRLKSDLLPKARIAFADLNDFEMPIYSIDRETNGGIPQAARSFFATIGAADAVLVSFAEHNGSVTSAWKNIFDWMSRIHMKVGQNKPAVFLAATPGPRSGAGVLGSHEMMAPFFGADLRGTLGISTWARAWDAVHRLLLLPEDQDALDAILAGLSVKPAPKEVAA
ncbi:MAG: NAD(P)H-dependent oxidoreductase [Pseudomonadota bacterium]